MEKVHDFGVFGKWSLATLKAQCKTEYMGGLAHGVYNRVILPQPITDKCIEVHESIEDLKAKKLRRLTVEDLTLTYVSMGKLEAELKHYNKICSIVLNSFPKDKFEYHISKVNDII